MSLITTSVANLVGGVSQQPSSLRLPNQCERQENAVASAFEGLIKRPPAEHVAVLKSGGSEITYDSAYVHMIDRDNAERYAVVFGRTNSGATAYIKVYDINGVEKTVTAPNGLGYINEADIDTKLRCVTVADVTFVLNRNKTVLASNTLSPYTRGLSAPTATYSHRQALLWVRQTNYGRNYAFSITANGIEYTYSYSTGTGSTDAIGTDLIATKLAEGSSHTGNGEANANYAAGVTTIVLKNHTGTVPTAGTKLAGRSIPPDTTVVSHSQVSGLHTIVISRELSGPLAVNSPVFVWASNVTIHHGYSSDPISGIGVKTSDNIIWVYGDNYPSSFAISSSDDFGGDGLKLSNSEAYSFDQLPNSAPHNYLIKIVGSGGTAADDYWVVFKQSGTPSTTEIRPGTWVESMAPGIEYKLDDATMPHVLIRQTDGTFMFKKADGLNGYPDFDWEDRVVGDDDSSPFPSFVDYKIRDINFFKDRLVILSGEYITLSETGNPFNFWISTVQNLVDTDSIEVGSTQPSVMDFKSSVVFSDRLVAFTPQTQLTLKGENILSARTVSLTTSAAYENTDCQPVISGTNIFFAFNRGSFAGIREMFVSNSLDAQFDATDLTVQVPQYLPGKIVKIAASTHENFLVTLCSGDRSTLFVYKYYNQGDQRIQSAWCKFTFRDAYILDMQFLDTVLYIVMKRGSSTVIEKIRLESGLKDTNSTYVTTLDRRLDQSGVTAAYNAGTGLTTYTLPYTITTNASMAVVTKSGLSLATTKASSTSLTVPGNYTTNVWIGDKYTMVYQFSEPTLKTPVQTGGIATIAAGRYQLRYGTISYGNSSFFKVNVQIDAGSTYSYIFNSRNVGDINNLVGSVAISTGDFRFPVYSRNTQVKISVENDSPLPSNLLSAEYEALFSERSTRR
jgi:hypothetical protein